MAQVLVRDIDEETVERLKEQARKRGRSLEAELRSIIEDAAKYGGPEFAKICEQLRADLTRRGYKSDSDPADLIREDRDSR